MRLEVTPSLLPACGPRVVTAKSWRIMVRNVLRFVSAKEKRDRMRRRFLPDRSLNGMGSSPVYLSLLLT